MLPKSTLQILQSTLLRVLQLHGDCGEGDERENYVVWKG